MKPSHALRLLSSCALALVPLMAGAQEIAAIHVTPQRAAVGEPVEVTLTFARGKATLRCGLRVMMGDGTSRSLRVDEPDEPLSFTHTYSRAGDFSVSGFGELYARGLGSAVPCTGEEKRAHIKVVDVAAERQRDEAERQARVAKERAEKLAAERDAELERERARRLAIERKLQEREEALRQREADARKLERRERELAARAEAVKKRERELAAAAERKSAQNASSGGSKAASRGAEQKSPRVILDAF